MRKWPIWAQWLLLVSMAAVALVQISQLDRPGPLLGRPGSLTVAILAACMALWIGFGLLQQRGERTKR
jgi:hypothetical protein